MIIETSDNRFYLVTEVLAPGYEHCWNGYPVKRMIRRHKWVLTASGKRAYDANRPQLIRKDATRVVEA